MNKNKCKIKSSFLFLTPLITPLLLVAAKCSEDKKPDFPKQNEIVFEKDDAINSLNKNIEKFSETIEQYLKKQFLLNNNYLNKLLKGENLEITKLPNNQIATHQVEALLWNLTKKSNGIVGIFKDFSISLINNFDGLFSQLNINNSLKTKMFSFIDSIDNILLLELTKTTAKIALDAQNNKITTANISSYFSNNTNLLSSFTLFSSTLQEMLYDLIVQSIVNSENNDEAFNKELKNIEPKLAPLKTIIKNSVENIFLDLKKQNSSSFSLMTKKFQAMLFNINSKVLEIAKLHFSTEENKNKFNQLWDSKLELYKNFIKDNSMSFVSTIFLIQNNLQQISNVEYSVDLVKQNNLKIIDDFLKNAVSNLKNISVSEEDIQKLTNENGDPNKNIFNNEGYKKIYEIELDKILNYLINFNAEKWTTYVKNIVNRNFSTFLNLITQRQTNNLLNFVSLWAKDKSLTYEKFVENNNTNNLLNEIGNLAELKQSIDYLFLSLAKEAIDQTLALFNDENYSKIVDLVQPLRDFYNGYFEKWKDVMEQPNLIKFLAAKVKWDLEKESILNSIQFKTEQIKTKFKNSFNKRMKLASNLLENMLKGMSDLSENVEKVLIKRIESL
ncbi:hypothetical protein [Metamycoplasma salivarium]|uniref:hypothetical protein n=1 Tax=Metamycoplasma salivarium TaxID=2124 RepID=UPI001F2BABB6|nr:hypothetical protein [Metamycoplasma salivarium]GIZ07247.1 hypothetical protein MSATCC33130_6010 [Metamycoplasma salivarium]